MTTPTPPGDGSQYIADREHAAYEQSYQQHAEMNDSFFGIGEVLNKAISQANATKVAEQYGQQQAQTLSVDQELREKPDALGNTHYLSFEHKEMDRFVRDNFDPGAVHDIGRDYHASGSELLEFAEQIRQAARKTEQSWEGEAGDAMRQHVYQLADHMSHSGSASQLTANQIGLQAEAGERARNSMPEVIEFDMKEELKNYFSDPNPFTAISRANAIVEKQEQSQAAHQEAAQVMATMETDFGSAAAQTPAFVPAPRGPEQQTNTPPQSQQPIGSIGTPSVSSTPSSTQSAWASPNTSTPQFSPPSTSSVPPSNTNAVWQQSPVSPSSDTRSGMRWNPQTGLWERQNPYNGRWAPLPPGQQRPGPGGGRPGVPGGGRPGGMGGAGAGRVGGIGGAGGTGSQIGAGGRAGVGGLGAAGGAGAGGSGAAGAAGARGGAGMAGAGAAGRGHGGKSEEDDERESKYVLETDEAWEDLGLPKVAPPVFGE